MSQYAGKIVSVQGGSLAEEIGLETGDRILAVNGQNLRDIIDLSFAFAEEEIELLIEKSSGEQELIEFDKEYDEELGVEFESAAFDGIRNCANRCYFCFVDQIAPGMRGSLSVKDDDYRMSFLYGNFVTLTNMGPRDFDRIKRLHLSPLFVSVHTTHGALRAKMLNNKRAADILPQLQQLGDCDIEYHTQIVLCPGYNDGAELDRTIADLMALRPQAQTLAIVPVGLTRYRENCQPLTMFDREGAGRVIDQVEKWQQKNREQDGTAFVYLGDEFYFLAGRELPAAEAYDGFPQLDNGIGLTRNFITEWYGAGEDICNPYAEPIYLDIICGKSIAAVLEKLIKELAVENLQVRVLPVENDFFGQAITVSGLLTGRDILKALQGNKGHRSGIILPASTLRDGEDVFLDDYLLSDLQEQVGAEIKIAADGSSLYRLLTDWFGQQLPVREKAAYTWQSNAGYTKLAAKEE